MTPEQINEIIKLGYMVFDKGNSVMDISTKEMVIRKLETIKGIGTFLKTSDGYKVTAPEGFVAIDTKGGAVKLVDRLTFSHANFTIAKDWVKG